MIDVNTSPAKTLNSAKGPSFTEGISKSSYVKQASDFKSSSVKAVNCHKSIYILAQLRYVTLYRCSDATIVLEAVSKILIWLGFNGKGIVVAKRLGAQRDKMNLQESNTTFYAGYEVVPGGKGATTSTEGATCRGKANGSALFKYGGGGLGLAYSAKITHPSRNYKEKHGILMIQNMEPRDYKGQIYYISNFTKMCRTWTHTYAQRGF
ncbi:TBCC domain-containing 1-like, partial [Olea europaea subsp. europaea]